MNDTETEKRRLAAVIRLGLLETPPEERFERLTHIARRYAGAGDQNRSSVRNGYIERFGRQYDRQPFKEL